MPFSKSVQQLGLRTLGHEAHVAEIRKLSASVFRVGLRAARVSNVAFSPGCKIKVHIGEGEMRSYTPASVDAARGSLDLIIFAQGDSPASRWVNALRPGHTLRFLGPAPSVAAPTGEEPWVAFYGDETAIGLAEALFHQLPPGTPTLGAVETRPEESAAVEHLSIAAVARGDRPGEGLVEHARQVELPAGPGVVWLSGEATAVLALRQAWLDRGVPRERLRIKPYWSLRGKDHRKTLERTVLRS